MTTLIAEFTVVGTPVPQGSTRAFSRGGKIHTTNDPTGTIERWRGDIRRALRDAVPGFEMTFQGTSYLKPATGPVSMRLTFRLARPKSHFLPANSKRPTPVLRVDAPEYVSGPPDGDKLTRACADALTGICYLDDAQVAVFGVVKRYANPGQQPGVDVRVSAL